MVKGHFKSFVHDHFFETNGEETIMQDDLDLRSPYSFVGTIVDGVFLDGYFKKFLKERNQMIKDIAESDQWVEYLD